MEALRELLTAHGYGDVRTYVQSGNVVLDSPSKPSALERASSSSSQTVSASTSTCSFARAAELAAVLERNPLAADRDRPQSRSSSRSCGGSRARSSSRDWPPSISRRSSLAVGGREIYSWHPSGVGRSELAKQLAERSLGSDGDGAELEHAREAAGARGLID